jgi:hypothetical protein
MAHKTNIGMHSLAFVPMVLKLEYIFQSLYGYFSSSPKRHLEFMQLVEIVKLKGF